MERQGRTRESRLEDAVALAEGKAGGYLNPEFVEWLMGYQMGWTMLDFAPSEMPFRPVPVRCHVPFAFAVTLVIAGFPAASGEPLGV